MTEDQLREQMGRVDELTPPDNGFEAKALYAGQRRLARRRSWTTGLVGAAAAVVVGGVVIHLGDSGSNASTSSAGAAPEQGQSGAATPGLSSDNSKAASGPGPSAGPNRGPGIAQETSPATLPTTVPGRGFDWQSSASTTALTTARATLSAPPYDEVYTGMAIYDQASPVELRVSLTRFDPAAMRVVTDAFPAGSPIAFVQSAYSARACATTLKTVNGDLPALRSAGFPVVDVACNIETGRVDIRLEATATTGQRSSLATRYGDVVNITE